MPKITNREKLEHVDPILESMLIYLTNYLQTDAIITSGARSQQHQEEIYKEKFGKDWEKYIPKNSAHIYKEGQLAQAIDFRMKWTFITKVHAKVLDIIPKFGITGIGIDIFKDYIHVDRKQRNLKEVLLWVYNSSGKIVYLK